MTKKEVLEMLEALPEETASESFDKLATEIQKIRFMSDVQAGLDDIERGELVTHEEIEKEMAAWLQE